MAEGMQVYDPKQHGAWWLAFRKGLDVAVRQARSADIDRKRARGEHVTWEEHKAVWLRDQEPEKTVVIVPAQKQDPPTSFTWAKPPQE